MAGKVKGIREKARSFDSCFVSFPFLILLFSCTLIISGCNGTQKRSANSGIVHEVPAEVQKAELQRSLDSKFENPNAHYQLGQLYHAEGLWTKAEYHYNVALSFDPALREAQAAMVKLFLDSGDTAKSKTYAGMYMTQVSKSPGQALRLGMAFQKQMLDEYALACYKQALHLAPNSAIVNKQLGYYYLSKNDTVRAKEYLTRSFQLDPAQSEVAGELGRLGVEVRIPGKAEATPEKIDKTIEKTQ